MKIKALIVLIAVILSASLPLKITVHAKNVSVITLDICHAAGAALSAQTDVPCVLQCPSALQVFEIGVRHAAVDSVFNTFRLSARLERPPKI